MSGQEINVTNVVGTGDIQWKDDDQTFEIDIEALSEELGPETWTNDGPHPGLYMRIDEGNEDAPLTTFFRSGKYIIRAESLDRLYEENERVIDELERIGAVTDKHTLSFAISNVVCVSDLEQTINLEALAIALPLENVEYEPEQFPALIYRDDEEHECTFLIFANGKVVIPGGTDPESVRDSYDEFLEHIHEFELL